MSSVNETLAQKYLQHALYIQTLEKKEAAHIAKFLKKDVIPLLESRLKETLEKFEAGKITNKTQIDRLQSTLESMNAQVQMAMLRAENRMMYRFKSIAGDEVKWNVATMQKTIPLDVDLFAPSAQFIHGIVESQVIEGKKLQTWLKSFSKSNQKGIMKSAKIGIAAGESIPQIGKRIRSSLNMARNRAEWLARTVTSATVHNVRNETLKANGHLLQGVQWVSTLDTRTTDLCQGYDGKLFPVDDGPRPPAHFNCRSTIVPMVKSWKEFGFKDPAPSVRSALGGYVPSTSNYNDWLNKYIGAKPGKGVKPPKNYPKGTKIVDVSGKVTTTTAQAPAPAVPPSMKVLDPPKPPAPAPAPAPAPYIVDKILIDNKEQIVHIDPSSGLIVKQTPVNPSTPPLASLPEKEWVPTKPLEFLSAIESKKDVMAYTYHADEEIPLKAFMRQPQVAKDKLAVDILTRAGTSKILVRDAAQNIIGVMDYSVDNMNLNIQGMRIITEGKGAATAMIHEIIDVATAEDKSGIFFKTVVKDDFWYKLGWQQSPGMVFIDSSRRIKAIQSAFLAFPGEQIALTEAAKAAKIADDTTYAWIKSLSEKEYTALRAYSGSDYSDIKQVYWEYLSGKINHLNDLPEWRRKYLEYAVEIENALSRAPAYKGELHRGMTLHNEGDIKSFFKHYKEGNTVSFANANSFSSSERIANSFAGWESPTQSDAVRVKIKMVRAPSKRCADIKSISRHADEDEILIGADQEYRVIKVQEFPPIRNGGNKRIYVELEPIENE